MNREESLERTDSAIRLKVKLSRGDGVRDAEEVTGELVAPDMDEFEARLEAFRSHLYTEALRARYWNPAAPEVPPTPDEDMDDVPEAEAGGGE